MWGNVYYVGDWLGSTVAAAGDVDGDGSRDVVAATNDYALYTPIFSGKDDSTIRSFTPLWNTRGAVAALGDLTGDGLPEIGVNYYNIDTTFAIFSSLDGKVLWRTDEFNFEPPETVAAAPDVDGDGRPDFTGFPRDGIDFRRAELHDERPDRPHDAPSGPPPRLEVRANEGPPGNLAALALTGSTGRRSSRSSRSSHSTRPAGAVLSGSVPADSTARSSSSASRSTERGWSSPPTRPCAPMSPAACPTKTRC